ncbi:MAG: cytochrome c-type biogenesis protein CcmH [Thiobacillaceae bacterium]|nr:cytochrome c-type biogenesis protein CcmH [Thiobacillaceae bacterium]
MGAALPPDAAAREARPLAEDPALEERLVRLAEELRCVVCQNESLASSRADLAEDLRREVRDLLRAGKSDQDVIEFLTHRYGDFVLYRPPFRPETWLLWLGPALIAAAAAGGLLLYLRRSAAAAKGSRDAAPHAAYNDLDEESRHS